MAYPGGAGFDRQGAENLAELGDLPLHPRDGRDGGSPE